MKHFLLLAFSLIVVSLVAQTKVNVSPFQSISTSGSLKVKLVQAARQSVEYKMVSGDADDLEIKVEGGKLILKTKSSFFWWKQTKAEIVVYHTGLSLLRASAGSSIKSDDLLKGQNMSVDASSGAFIKAALDAQDASVDCSSGASIELRGSAQFTNMEVSSGGSIRAGEFNAGEASVRSSSGGSLSLQVSKGLDAHASSGGSIQYKGSIDGAKVNTKTSSGGSVSRM